MEAMGMMRDLDQIQEREDNGNARTVVIAVGGLAAACVLFAAGILIGRDQDTTRATRQSDPLARLDALAAQSAQAPAPTITYPSRLVDRTANTVAAPTAVQDSVTPSTTAPTTAAVPSLRVGPGAAVPASALVETTGAVRDLAPSARLPITAGASVRLSAQGAQSTTPASAGSDGAFTLQVSSFRTLGSAQTFATRLRERGHRSFVASGLATTGTGTWHRVRIGPFANMRDVARYRADFEARERLPTFIVRQGGEPAGSSHR